MREPVMIDVRAVWKEMQALPDKGYAGSRRILTNEEEWMIYLLRETKSQKTIAKSMHISTDRIGTEYKRLKAQGGPKGARPEWMK